VSIRHPARHFIHYLLSRRVHNTAAVIKQMKEFELPLPDRFYYGCEVRLKQGPAIDPDRDGDFGALCHQILKTRHEMEFPAEFEPHVRRPNAETSAFLRKWKIHDMWRGVPATHRAIEMLMDPPIRSALELFLLSPLAARDIAHRISQRFELDPATMDAATVRAFGHYFWDVNALSPSEWRLFVSSHRSSEREDYLSMLQAPRSVAGAAFSIAVIDRDPQLLPPVDRYRAASAMAFSMLMRQMASDKNGAPYAAHTALNMMRMADDELAKHEGASSELLAEFERIKTLHDTKRPLAITDAPFMQRRMLLVKNDADDKEPTDG
jgi:hypothetical protein